MIERKYIERFLNSIDRKSPEECWPWKAGKSDRGYGQISIGGRKGKTMYAHRLAYELAHGEIPAGKLVCHRCDNRECCNPAHLFVGTIADNIHDMVHKGRHAKGEANGQATLTACAVKLIFNLASSGMTHSSVAKRLGVSVSHVSYIRNGKTWAHLKLANRKKS